MSKPIVAVVGRPNVGKSTLFNKLVGMRLSIVEDVPGVTRDRIYADCEWRGREFTLIDTGGIESPGMDPGAGDAMLSEIREQAQAAIDSADVIIFVTDLRAGVTATDQDVALSLMQSGKPVVLCVNKADSVGDAPLELYDFYSLGLGEPFPVSSVHGMGSGELLDAVLDNLGEKKDDEDDHGEIKVAIIGRPNSGKSSLVNCVLGERRVIVSDVPGTTRDAIDSELVNEHGRYVFIDTAGIRRRSRVNDRVERFSVLRALMAVERADVCIVMIDAQDGITEQDVRIAGYAHEAGKASLIVMNKWDIVEKETGTMERFKKQAQSELAFMSYAPVEFISALTGRRVQKLFPLINQVHANNCMRIPTGRLNEVLSDAVTRVQPPTDRGKRLKVLYMTQVGINPPTFVIFVNKKKLFHFSYQRYIENQLRAVFGLSGTPLRFIIREREDSRP